MQYVTLHKSKEEHLKQYNRSKERAHRIIAHVLTKPQHEAEASLRRLVAWTVHPERLPLYMEALEKVIELRGN